MKLNTNTSIDKHNSVACIGGIFKNEEENWLLNYHQAVGQIDITMAKIWAICIRLNYSNLLGIKLIEINFNSLCTVKGFKETLLI